MNDCPWIRSSGEYPDVPEWMRVSEYYGRGYTEVERRAMEAAWAADGVAFGGRNPDEVHPQRAWSAVDIAYLRQHYGQDSVRVLADFLDRSRPSIATKARFLGLCQSVGRTWMLYEIDYVQEHYKTTTAQKLADHLQRSRNSVLSKARQLGLMEERQKGAA